MKDAVMSMIRSVPLRPENTEKLLFLGKMGYWPDFDNPKTYNEKINWRKLKSTNALFVRCADKLAVRNYVSEKIGEQYLVPLLHGGEEISAHHLHELGDNIVIKANHDSGSACILRANTLEASKEAAEKIKDSIRTNYGARTNEWWYAKMKPMVCVERLLLNKDGGLAYDFKFFVFNQPEGDPKIFIEVDYERGTPNHHRTFYRGDRSIIDDFGRDIVIDDVPNHRTPFPDLGNYEEMLEVVCRLAEDFDHVRVDMYHADGQIYFGELTFSEGGGRSKWQPRAFDELLGDCWELDQSVGGRECPEVPPARISQSFVRQDALKRSYRRAKGMFSCVGNAIRIGVDQMFRFLVLPYLVIRYVDRDECPRNRLLVYLDHLYLFFVIGVFPDHYASCRLWEKPKKDWRLYYGRGYSPWAIARRNRFIRRPECDLLFEDKEVCYRLCENSGFPLPTQHAVLDVDQNLGKELETVFSTTTSDRLFLKPVSGDGGRGACLAERKDGGIAVREISAPGHSIPVSRFDLSFRSVVQEAVIQHSDVSRLYDGALNTVRIATLLTPDGEILIPGAFLRIGRGENFVDNGDQGGIGAKIDLQSGRLASFATDNRGRKFDHHPDTGVPFDSIRLPFWEDVMNLAISVQREFAPFNRFIGMDIGFGTSGPILIEVNDIFDCGRFESVTGPIFENQKVRQACLDYELIAPRRFQ